MHVRAEPTPAPTEVQASWEEAAEAPTATTDRPTGNTASREKYWPLPGAAPSGNKAELRHRALVDTKSNEAAAWAAAAAGDDAKAAQGDEEEFDTNMLWCATPYTQPLKRLFEITHITRWCHMALKLLTNIIRL